MWLLLKSIYIKYFPIFSNVLLAGCTFFCYFIIIFSSWCKQPTYIKHIMCNLIHISPQGWLFSRHKLYGTRYIYAAMDIILPEVSTTFTSFDVVYFLCDQIENFPWNFEMGFIYQFERKLLKNHIASRYIMAYYKLNRRFYCFFWNRIFKTICQYLLNVGTVIFFTNIAACPFAHLIIILSVKIIECFPVSIWRVFKQHYPQ